MGRMLSCWMMVHGVVSHDVDVTAAGWAMLGGGDALEADDDEMAEWRMEGQHDRRSRCWTCRGQPGCR